MLLLWKPGIPYWKVGLAFAFIGAGVGFAGTPASHSLTGSVPVRRAGMASGTADLQRDLGGAIMQSIMGALLTAGFATAISKAIAAAPNKARVTTNVENELTKSFSSAESVTQQYPHYSSAITEAARSSFVSGSDWAYAVGMIAIAIGAAVIFFLFPGKEDEQRLLAEYQAQDSGPAAARARPLRGRARRSRSRAGGRRFAARRSRRRLRGRCHRRGFLGGRDRLRGRCDRRVVGWGSRSASPRSWPCD